MSRKVSDHHKKCLLLNADYSPLRIISWQKAIIWSLRYEHNNNYGIEIISYYKDEIITGVGGTKYLIPSVARSVKFLNLYNKKITFSKYNLFIRDNYTCQYCGTKLPFSQLTLDHVIPKSRFEIEIANKTDWSNIVASCRRCNATKANKTPQEARMPIMTIPQKPHFSIRYLPMFRNLSTIHEEWQPYLEQFISNENQS